MFRYSEIVSHSIVVGWNSCTIALYLNTYFLALSFITNPSDKCLNCFAFVVYTDMSKLNDKPTMPNSLTIVGGWNSDTISLYNYT